MKVRTLVGRYAGEVRDIRPREALLMIKDGRAEPLSAQPHAGHFPVPNSSEVVHHAGDSPAARQAMYEVTAGSDIPANAQRLNAGLPREKQGLLRRKRASEQ